MKIKNIFGREVNKSFSKHRIDWDKKVSVPQKKVKDLIRQHWAADDVYEELLIPGSKMRVDLINFTKKIAIEVSPESSHGYSDFFNKTRSNFLAAKKREIKKFEWLEMNGVETVELRDEDLKNNNWIRRII